MARPELPVDASDERVAEFALNLRQLRMRAGNPTYREMSKVAMASSSVLSSAASGRRLPTLQATLGFVEACGGSVADWRNRWIALAASLHGDSLTLPTRREFDGTESTMPIGSSRPAQLPLPRTALVDSRASVQDVCVPGRPVLITGQFGVGKSVFAHHHAQGAAGQAADGQLYADFSDRNRPRYQHTSHVLDGFLLALGIRRDDLPVSMDQRQGLFRTLLCQRRLLVLLDNIDDEDQLQPFVGRSAHSVVLATARSPLLGLDHVRRIKVGRFERKISIELLLEGIDRPRPTDRDVCDRIAAGCGDLPLAIDIVRRRIARLHSPDLAAVERKIRVGPSALDWLHFDRLSYTDYVSSAYGQVSDAARDHLDRLASMREPIKLDESVQYELLDAGLLKLKQPGTCIVDHLVRTFVASRMSPVTTFDRASERRVGASMPGNVWDRPEVKVP